MFLRDVLNNRCSTECATAIGVVTTNNIWDHCKLWHLEVLTHGRILDGAISLCDQDAPTNKIKIASDGRLEMYMHGLWSSVCVPDVLFFGRSNLARHLCKQMGFVNGKISLMDSAMQSRVSILGVDNYIYHNLCTDMNVTKLECFTADTCMDAYGWFVEEGGVNVTCASTDACDHEGSALACCDCGRTCTAPSAEVDEILTHFQITDPNLCISDGDQYYIDGYKPSCVFASISSDLTPCNSNKYVCGYNSMSGSLYDQIQQLSMSMETSSHPYCPTDPISFATFTGTILYYTDPACSGTSRIQSTFLSPFDGTCTQIQGMALYLNATCVEPGTMSISIFDDQSCFTEIHYGLVKSGECFDSVVGSFQLLWNKACVAYEVDTVNSDTCDTDPTYTEFCVEYNQYYFNGNPTCIYSGAFADCNKNAFVCVAESNKVTELANAKAQATHMHQLCPVPYDRFPAGCHENVAHLNMDPHLCLKINQTEAKFNQWYLDGRPLCIGGNLNSPMDPCDSTTLFCPGGGNFVGTIQEQKVAIASAMASSTLTHLRCPVTVHTTELHMYFKAFASSSCTGYYNEVHMESAENECFELFPESWAKVTCVDYKLSLSLYYDPQCYEEGNFLSYSLTKRVCSPGEDISIMPTWHGGCASTADSVQGTDTTVTADISIFSHESCVGPVDSMSVTSLSAKLGACSAYQEDWYVKLECVATKVLSLTLSRDATCGGGFGSETVYLHKNVCTMIDVQSHIMYIKSSWSGACDNFNEYVVPANCNFLDYKGMDLAIGQIGITADDAARLCYVSDKNWYYRDSDTCVAANLENAWGACTESEAICGLYGGNAGSFGFLWNQLIAVKDALTHPPDFQAEGCPIRWATTYTEHVNKTCWPNERLEELSEYTYQDCEDACNIDPMCGGFEFFEPIGSCSISSGRFCNVQPAQSTSSAFVRSGRCLKPKEETIKKMKGYGLTLSIVSDWDLLCFNQAFVWEYDGISTCVGASPLLSDLFCNADAVVCGAEDRFGTLEDQTRLLIAALAEVSVSTFIHPDCPLYEESVPGNFDFNDLKEDNEGIWDKVDPEDPLNCIGGWSDFSQCSVSCGVGSYSRTYNVTQNLTQVCVDDETFAPGQTVKGYCVSGSECAHDHGYVETIECTTGVHCPLNCVGEFSAWSTCDATCGGGKKTRTFEVEINADYGGEDCKYNGLTMIDGDLEFDDCNSQECLPPCVFEWSAYSNCSATCGYGTRTKTYHIKENAQYCDKQDGSLSIEDCTQLEPCLPDPIDCDGDWSDYSECSVSCGMGSQSRTYSISVPGNGYGEHCTHGHGVVENTPCNAGHCPIPCDFEWSVYSEHGKVCGVGTQTRTLNVRSEPLYDGEACPAQTVETKTVELEDCPSVCQGDWGAYSTCTASCGGGERTRTYTISSAGSSLPCPFENEEEEITACNTESCDADCDGAWEFGACSTTCGDGFKVNTYKVYTAKRGTGADCPFENDHKQSLPCNVRACLARGCTDQTASNYDSAAEIDDGSCTNIAGLGYKTLDGFWKCVGEQANLDYGGNIGAATLVGEFKTHKGYYLGDTASMTLPSITTARDSLSLTFQAFETSTGSIFGNTFYYDYTSKELTFLDHSATVPPDQIVIQIEEDSLQLGDQTFSIKAIELKGAISFGKGYITCVQISDIQSGDSITYNRNRCENSVECNSITDGSVCVNSGCDFHDSQCIEFCAPLCYKSMIGNGRCDQVCRNAACSDEASECQTASPTASPTFAPLTPTKIPTSTPTSNPTPPSAQPTKEPTKNPLPPSPHPSNEPTSNPLTPTNVPSKQPTSNPLTPTRVPTIQPTSDPVECRDKCVAHSTAGESYEQACNGYSDPDACNTVSAEMPRMCQWTCVAVSVCTVDDDACAGCVASSSDGESYHPVANDWCSDEKSDGVCMYQNAVCRGPRGANVPRQQGDLCTRDGNQIDYTDINAVVQGMCASGLTCQLMDSEDWGQCVPVPTTHPTKEPTSSPTADPSQHPTSPSAHPTGHPTSGPTKDPTSNPSKHPSSEPTSTPSMHPTSEPTMGPSANPTSNPSVNPSNNPTAQPSLGPSTQPTLNPTSCPSSQPSFGPTAEPTYNPTTSPSFEPTSMPSMTPTDFPTKSFSPTSVPTANPTSEPTANMPPTSDPSTNPSFAPTGQPTNPPVCTMEQLGPCIQPATTYSDVNTFCPTLNTAATCINSLECLLSQANLYRIPTLYNAQCTDEDAGPYPYYEVSDGKCQGGTENEVGQSNALFCQATCNSRRNCLGFATVSAGMSSTCYLYADSITHGSATSTVSTGKCYEKVTDLCVAKDCNDKGTPTAGGRRSDDGGCQCECESGWGGDNCSEQLKVKQEVSYKDTTKTFVENNKGKFESAYAIVVGKDVSKVKIKAIRQIASRRRRLSVSVEVDYEVEVDTVAEKTTTVEKVEEANFADELAETLETQESITVEVAAVEVFAECTRAANCNGNGSTSDEDTRDGCDCTCDEGWTIADDCSVPVPPPTMSPTVEPTKTLTTDPVTMEPTKEPVASDGGANTSTSTEESGTKTYMYIIYGGAAVAILLAIYCVVSRYTAADSTAGGKDVEVEMNEKRTIGATTEKSYHTHAPDDTDDLEQYGAQKHNMLTE